MARAPRGTARNLTLAAAGAVLFVVGYFAGSRYVGGPLSGLSAVTFGEPVELSPPMGVRLGGRWQLLVVGNMTEGGCQRRLATAARIFNRLAHRPDLTQRLGLLAVSSEASRLSKPPDAQVAYWEMQTTDEAGLAELARQLGLPAADLPQCRNQPLALLDTAGRLRALFPAHATPSVAAADLERILDTWKDSSE